MKLSSDPQFPQKELLWKLVGAHLGCLAGLGSADTHPVCGGTSLQGRRAAFLGEEVLGSSSAGSGPSWRSCQKFHESPEDRGEACPLERPCPGVLWLDLWVGGRGVWKPGRVLWSGHCGRPLEPGPHRTSPAFPRAGVHGPPGLPHPLPACCTRARPTALPPGPHWLPVLRVAAVTVTATEGDTMFVCSSKSVFCSI